MASKNKLESRIKNLVYPDHVPENKNSTLQECDFHIVLVKPEIPNNTGNIGRTCIGMNAHLHIVGPTSFEITDKRLRRAGLDYWKHLTWFEYEGWEDFWVKKGVDIDREHLYFLTTKTEKALYSSEIEKGSWFFFGSETKGLSEEIRTQFENSCVTIPMHGPIRSYNLANTVAVVLHEASRQIRI